LAVRMSQKLPNSAKYEPTGNETIVLDTGTTLCVMFIGRKFMKHEGNGEISF